MLLVLGLAACSPQVSQHGHTIEPETLSRLTPGTSSREEVLRLLGSPSTLATFEDDRWYYVTQRRESRSFYQSQITEQDVVVVSFDDQGILRGVEHRSLDQAMGIEPNSDRTRTLGSELTIVEQLIGNIGRFGDPTMTPGANRPSR